MSSTERDPGREVSYNRMRTLPFFGATATSPEVLEELGRLREEVKQLRNENVSLKTEVRETSTAVKPVVAEFKEDEEDQIDALRNFNAQCTEPDPKGRIDLDTYKQCVMWYAFSHGVILPETKVTRRLKKGKLTEPATSNGERYVPGRKLLPVLPWLGSQELPVQGKEFFGLSPGTPMSPAGSPNYNNIPTQMPTISLR